MPEARLHIRTERLILRRLEADDLDAFHGYRFQVTVRAGKYPASRRRCCLAVFRGWLTVYSRWSSPSDGSSWLILGDAGDLGKQSFAVRKLPRVMRSIAAMAWASPVLKELRNHETQRRQPDLR